MPAPWTWAWMLLAVMSLTLGQSVAEVISEAISENNLTPELRSGKNACTKCHLLYPKEEYRLRNKKQNEKTPHNAVFLVEDRRTGRDVKVAFRNGIKNEKGVRVLQSKNPCQKFSKKCVYRLISRRTGRPFKIDFKKCLQNGKQTVKLSP